MEFGQLLCKKNKGQEHWSTKLREHFNNLAANGHFQSFSGSLQEIEVAIKAKQNFYNEQMRAIFANELANGPNKGNMSELCEGIGKLKLLLYMLFYFSYKSEMEVPFIKEILTGQNCLWDFPQVKHQHTQCFTSSDDFSTEVNEQIKLTDDLARHFQLDFKNQPIPPQLKPSHGSRL